MNSTYFIIIADTDTFKILLFTSTATKNIKLTLNDTASNWYI
ncbi:MAG: hypothetical protein WA099_02330 [Sulfuricurvum sp.]